MRGAKTSTHEINNMLRGTSLITLWMKKNFPGAIFPQKKSRESVPASNAFQSII